MVGPPFEGCRPGIMVPNTRPYEAARERDADENYSPAGCFAQLALGLGGLVLAVIMWYTIARESRWTISIRDVVYWSAILALIAARLDSRFHKGYAAADPVGAAETPDYVRRFGQVVLLLSALAWGVAHSVEF
jgi:hypothetical protein